MYLPHGYRSRNAASFPLKVSAEEVLGNTLVNLTLTFSAITDVSWPVQCIFLHCICMGSIKPILTLEA